MNTRARVTAVPALLAAGALATLPGFLKTAAAHQATPAAGAAAVPAAWADLGLPELNLTIGEAIEGMPESVEAGRYLLTVSGEPGPEDFAIGAVFMQLPEGLSLDDALAQAGEATDAAPAFFNESIFASGAAALVPAGQTSATAIVDLSPGAGQWIALDPSFSRQPIAFEVTGEVPADLAEPEANVTLGMGEMYIELNEGSLVAGENLIKVVNEGVQPHFIEVLGVPEGTTNDNITGAIEAEMGATPSAEPVDINAAMPAAYMPEQSEGVVAWHAVTLEAGTYAVMCWITDPETGMPHAMLGMHNVFVVE
jgi:hypothetical protein